MKDIYIIYFFLILILFIKMVKKNENFSQMSNLKKKILNKFNFNIESVRNLSNISADILKNNELVIHGGLNITGNLNILPRGIILAWNKQTIPSGWAICNGKNGTPNLMGRGGTTPKFLLGKSNSKNLKSRGGNTKVTLNLNMIPSHNHGNASITSLSNHSHSITGSQSLPNSSSYDRVFCSPTDGVYGSCGARGNNFKWVTLKYINSLSSNYSGKHSHYVDTGNTGGNQSHDNMPPYYVLIWIMKL